MPLPLPDRFILNDFTGLRAQQFERREDRFQQFVGDVFLSLCGSRAHVGPTRGQDGSIDIYVEQGCSALDSYFGLPAPTIIEVKDHDDRVGASNLRKNIRKTWAELEEKLERQASGGWNGLFAPWHQTRGYLYCVSAVLPAQEDRDWLEKRIGQFFSRLPRSDRPPIESVRVIDWNDLRALGRNYPRLLDDWMGSGVSTIKTLREQEATLDHFLAFLREDTMPFVAPGTELAFHPERLLAALDERRSAKGVVLLGSGGVGKTRTALEVGRLSQARGDRVLWVSPGETSATATEIGQVVGAESGNVLLILDYAEQMYELDWSVLRRTVLPDLRTQGSRVAVLANARSAWVARANPARDSFLDQVRMVPTEDHRAEVQRALVSHAAPAALALWGDHRVRSICGERPIIALLIGRELERLAARGELNRINTATLRQGELLQWLIRRLKEDEIGVPSPESLFQPAEPSREIVLVAGLVAVAPLLRAGLKVAGSVLLDEAPGSADLVEHVLRRLEEMGWLELHQDLLAPPHDVVADQILEDVVFDGASVRSSHLRQIVKASEIHVRNFGRIAVSLDRLIGGLSSARAVALRLAFRDLAPEIAASLRPTAISGFHDTASYALAASVSCAAFEDAADILWSDLISPWLEHNSDRREARHLLHRGLRAVLSDRASDLLGAAIAWLELFGTETEAGFVLGPLLGRDDLSDDQAERAIHKAIAWLELFGTETEAQFVFHLLLGRDDLSDDQAERAIHKAIAWLELFGTETEARFVLHPLLGRKGLSDDQAKSAIDKAIAWIELFGTETEAGFVLPPLLGRGELSDDQAERAIHKAIAWLGLFGTEIEAQFVLHALLGRKDLSHDQAERAIDKAIAWLELFGTETEARFVLRPLLGRKGLSDDQAKSAIDKAIAWLVFLGTETNAGYVLPPLLGRDDLSESQAKCAINHALTWLNFYPVTQDAEFVLKNLLSREDTSDDDFRSAVGYALSRLEVAINTPDATYILQSCLRSANRLDASTAQTLGHRACDWLSMSEAHNDADYVFNPLLRSKFVDDATWKTAADFAVRWLSTPRPTPVLSRALNSLLMRHDLHSPAALGSLIAQAVTLLEETKPKERDAYLLNSLIRIGNPFVNIEKINRLQAEMNPDIRIDDFIHLTQELRQMASTPDAAPPDPAFILDTCRRVEQRNNRSPASAAYAIAPLVTIAQSQPALQTRVIDVARLVLDDSRCPERSRTAVQRELRRLNGLAGQLDEESVTSLLDQLGLNRVENEAVPGYRSPADGAASEEDGDL